MPLQDLDRFFKKATAPLDEGLLASLEKVVSGVSQDFQERIPRFQERVVDPSISALKDILSFAGIGETEEGLKRRKVFKEKVSLAQITPEELAIGFTPMGTARVSSKVVPKIIQERITQQLPKPHIPDKILDQKPKNFVSSFVDRILRRSQEVKPTPEIPQSVQNIMTALKGAKPIRGEQEALYSAERAKRVGKVVGIGERIPGEAGYKAQLGALKGELPKVKFEGIREKVTQLDIDDLFNTVEKSNVLTPFEKITTKNGLSKLLGVEGGIVPTEGELKLLNEVFPPEFVKSILDKRSLGQKVGQLFGEAVNVPRAVMASTDVSAPLRQGLFVLSKQFFTHPIRITSTLKDMFKNFFSEKAYVNTLQDIQQRPTYQLMRENNLALTRPSEFLSQREEMFMSNLAEKIPVIGGIVRASNRAYTGFLNKLRADVFDDLYKSAEKQGVLAENPQIIENIADFVNNATGRGKLPGGLERSAVILNGIFFSPKLMASRLKLLNPYYYMKLDPFTRKEALKNLFTTTGTGLTILGLASIAGADIETNPTSTDFGKIKVGNTRYDIWGGFQQYVVLAARLIIGETKSSITGETYRLGEGYKPTTQYDLLLRYGENKLAPLLSFAVGLAKGIDFKGDPFEVTKEIEERFTPIVIGDMLDLIEDRGLEGVGMVLPTIFGVGTQTYKPKVKIPALEKSFEGKGLETLKGRNMGGLKRLDRLLK